MKVHIKTPEEIAKMRVAGRLAAEVLEMIEPHVKPGVTTEELDRLCHDHIVNKQKGIPACLGYRAGGRTPFPKSICTSVNDVICHGIPNDKPLKSGDIINIDVTVIKDGYHGDTSKMFLVGKPSKETIKAQRLMRVTQECLYKAIEIVQPGVELSAIGAIIQKEAEAQNYSVVREYCGHGIGSEFHEEGLQVLHYLEELKPGQRSRSSLILKPGMTFTIEPMINEGKADIKYPLIKGKWDGWTVVTNDRKLSAQWEHTILVTDSGFEVLTRRQEETRFW